MIDFLSLAANALWILGLALILAALSWAYWIAAQENVRFRVARALDGGLAATARTGWEHVLWGVLAGVWALLAIGLARR